MRSSQDARDRLLLIAALVVGVIGYIAIAGFLCAAAIVNPHLTDMQQWQWCAVAVAWGPVLAIAAWFVL